MKSKILKNKNGININGLFVLIPTKIDDSRGYFYESWNKKNFENAIKSKVNFVQDNQSKSKKGTLRGLHYQIKPYAQGKLVRCINGEIYDVAVDLRKNSKTFGEWIGIVLSEKNMNQLWIPEGFAHGFLTLSSYAEVLYKTTNYWSKDSERSIKWDDKSLLINWPFGEYDLDKPSVSKKDREACTFEEIINNSDFF